MTLKFDDYLYSDWEQYTKDLAIEMEKREMYLRNLKIFPDLYIEENEMMNMIETTCKLIGYEIKKNETKNYRDIKILKINAENAWMCDYIVVTYSLNTGRTLAGYSLYEGNVRKTAKMLDDYRGKSSVEVMKEVMGWL